MIKKIVIAVASLLAILVVGLIFDLMCEAKFVGNIPEWHGQRADELVNRYGVLPDSNPHPNFWEFRRDRMFGALWRMLGMDDHVIVYGSEVDGVVSTVMLACRYPSWTIVFPKLP